MAINAMMIGLILYFVFKSIGYAFNTTYFKDNLIANSSLGFALYFGIMQFFVYFTTFLHVPSKIMSLVYLGILGLLFVYSLTKFRLKVNYKSIGTVILTLFITYLLVVRSGSYTLGETSDSVFYMSMVNENAFKAKWTPMAYYSGIEYVTFNPVYDFQSLYHFFAYLIKLYSQFFTEISYAPVYVYTGLTLIIAITIDSVLSLFLAFYSKNKCGSIIGLFLLLVFNATCWITLYGYIGVSWKMLVISIEIFAIYRYFTTHNKHYLTLIFISSNALIACLSSSLFINGFIMIAFLLAVLLTKNNDTSAFLVMFPTYLYLVTYFSNYKFPPIIYPILVSLFFVIYFVYIQFNKISLKVKKFIIYGCVGLLIVLMVPFSFKSDIPFGIKSFFGLYSNEMSVPIFAFHKLSYAITNIVWIVGVTCYIWFKRNSLNESFKRFNAIYILLFVNPLTVSCLSKIFTLMVHYRCFDVVLNFYTLIAAGCGIELLLAQLVKNTKLCGLFTGAISLVLCYPIVVNFNDSPYLNELNEPIDATYRIPVSELEADLELAQIAHSSPIRINTIAQTSYTKAIVRNIRLLFDVNYTRSFCKTCNVLEGEINAPSELHNLFMERDFADQPIFADPINWDNACNLLFENEYKLMVLNKEQTKLKDGIYAQIWMDMRACNDQIFENDQYVVMRYRY